MPDGLIYGIAFVVLWKLWTWSFRFGERSYYWFKVRWPRIMRGVTGIADHIERVGRWLIGPTTTIADIFGGTNNAGKVATLSDDRPVPRHTVKPKPKKRPVSIAELVPGWTVTAASGSRITVNGNMWPVYRERLKALWETCDPVRAGDTVGVIESYAYHDPNPNGSYPVSITIIAGRYARSRDGTLIDIRSKSDGPSIAVIHDHAYIDGTQPRRASDIPTGNWGTK